MRLLQIFPGEGAKTAWFAALGFLVHCGLAMGLSVTDAVFLSELGADELPMVYVIMPLFMILFTPLSSYIQSRFSIEKALSIALVAIACGAATLGLLFQTSIGDGNPGLVIFSGKIFTSIWYIGIYTIFWNFVDAYFPLSEGKRLYGIINAGSCGGVILAGGLLTALSSRVDSFWILYIWAALSILSIPVGIAIRRRFVNLEDTGESDTESVADTIRSSMRAVKRSKYALFTALLYFLLPLLNTANEFLSFSVFSKYGNEQEIIALFGQLYSIAYVFNLIISLFAFNFLVARIGVRNIVLIQPLVYFAAFFWYFSDFTFAAAVFGFFAYQTILCAVDNNNANLLFNALPYHEKRSIRTFIEGMGEPIAIAISGAALMYGLNTFPTSKIALFGIATTFIAAITAYIINQLYVGGIADNLRENRLSNNPDATPNQAKETIVSTRLGSQSTPVGPYAARIAASRLANVPPEAIAGILSTLRHTHDAQSIVDAIRAREDYTTDEHQILMQAAHDAGLGVVPGLLNILHNPLDGFRARSLAWDILSNLSYAQIEFAWKDLLSEAIQHAEQLRMIADSIPDTAPPDSALSVLQLSIGDLQNQSFEWMLHILSTAGKIPDHPVILASLDSGKPKDRANAAEILIEGLGLTGFRRIETYFSAYRPDSCSPAAPLKTVKESRLADNGFDTLIQRAILSTHLPIAIVAAHACIEGEANLQPGLLWSLLPHAPLRSSIISALSRSQTDASTAIPKAFLLKRSPLFHTLRMHSIHPLLPYFEHIQLKANTPTPQGSIFIPDREAAWILGAVSSSPIHIPRAYPLGLSAAINPTGVTRDFRPKDLVSGLATSSDRIQRILRIHPELAPSIMRDNLAEMDPTRQNPDLDSIPVKEEGLHA